jgi:putative hydrolase of the HAD superfamily
VACLTNTEPEIAEINKAGGLFDPFERAFLSTDMRLRKPQPEIFLAVLRELECRPDDALYIDDREVHVKGAESVGMTARLFCDCAQITSELAQILGTH